ncbi:MAG: S8 family serine peptidase [Caldimonas sp.]
MKFENASRLVGTSLLAAVAWCVGVSLPGQAQAAQPGAAVKAPAKVRVIVAFKPGSGAGARAAIAGAGGRVLLDLDEADGVAIELPASAVAALRRSPHVEFVEDDPVRHAFRPPGSQVRRPALLPARSPEQVPYGIPMVQADLVSDALASDRMLCIIDSGIDRGHADLAGISVDGVNLTDSGRWFTDENSHGTHVAGIVAAVDNAIGVVGVLPHRRISLFIAKVFDAEGSAPSSLIARAMLHCMRARANVVSMSLGGATTSRIEARVADLLARRNMLVIAAAGNEGDDTVSYPAGFASVVSVAAVDASKTVASFSQFNSDVELAGPGVDVLSTVPVGSQIGASLKVGATNYPVGELEGSPFATATGPLADFGFGDAPAAGSMSGKICLISRGAISFAAKVLNCQDSGGVGAVVYNNAPGDVNGTLGTTVTTIPSVGALQTDGALMLGQLGQPATVAVFPTRDAYAYYSGTSMSTPYVSGVAALVWSYFPHCTASEIRASLDKSAQDLGTPGRDVYYGFGLVQAKAAHTRIGMLGCGH